MTTAPTTCVIYVRQSLDRTGQQAAVDRQERECRELAAALGLQVLEVYPDNDTSAFSGKKRPGFEALLASGCEAIVAWHIDRLARRTIDLEPVLALGVNVYTVAGGVVDLSTPMGRAHAKIGVTMAQYESEQKGERQRAAHRQRRARGGTWWHARRPLGFDVDGTPRPDEIEVVRDLYRRCLAGESFPSLEADAGMTDSGVRELLLNDRNREHVGDDLFDAVGALLRSRRTGYRHGAGMLTGVAVCGVCGAPCKVATNPRGVSVYKCRPHGHASYPRAALDEFVGTQVAGELADARERIEGQATSTDGEIAGLFVDFMAGRLTAEQLEAARARVTQRASRPVAPWRPWAQLTEPERRRLCRALLEKVEIPRRGKGSQVLRPPQDDWLHWRTQPESQ